MSLLDTWPEDHSLLRRSRCPYVQHVTSLFYLSVCLSLFFFGVDLVSPLILLRLLPRYLLSLLSSAHLSFFLFFFFSIASFYTSHICSILTFLPSPHSYYTSFFNFFSFSFTLFDLYSLFSIRSFLPSLSFSFALPLSLCHFSHWSSLTLLSLLSHLSIFLSFLPLFFSLIFLWPLSTSSPNSYFFLCFHFHVTSTQGINSSLSVYLTFFMFFLPFYL